jgi:exodeoxyribonuclease V alpha subunit
MPDTDSQIELEGQIERVTYSNQETGYTVARISVPGHREPVTIVGNILGPTPGEVLLVKGAWINHPRFGRQFRVDSHSVRVPATVPGIKKYLASGLIKGIGAVMAERIVKEFGEKTLEVIEHQPEELARIEGLGPKRVEMIKKGWADQREIRDIMIFLQTYGVGSAYAAKIFRQYRGNSISIVKRNPYRLATDIFGIGFSTADKIAGELGFEKTSIVRVEAGILYVMDQISEEGHVYYPYDLLLERCRRVLEVDTDTISEAFGMVVSKKKLVVEDVNKDLDWFKPNKKAVYLTRFYVSETGVAESMSRITATRKNIRDFAVDKAVEWVQKKIRLQLVERQIEAVKGAISDKVTVITGGPGTGKTTIISAVIKIYQKLGTRVLLAAPTGRASKRMSEATGYPAKTVHRMLEFSYQKGGFQRNENRPLEVDVLILDEVSMMDTILMHHLLKAVPEVTTVVLVGDADQLPSVGAGSVLKDIIDSGTVPVVELNEIFRQAGKSLIIVNAHRINKGLMPDIGKYGDDLEDFYFIEQEDQAQVLEIIKELVGNRIPQRFGLDPIDGIQVISPMHKGMVGTGTLNVVLQEALNPSQIKLTRGDRVFKLHDKVMQVRNNYEKEVFNGDIGRITGIDPEDRQITVSFDHSAVLYDYADLDEIIPAYAISVHKSQGSEYPAVVIPILSQHYVLLQRNLIYTAVTRGKRLVVIVGSKKALAMGIKNDRVMQRYTYLSERLKRAANR